MIETFESTHPGVSHAVFVMASYRGPLPEGGYTTLGEVEARVNHGRWLVDCPACKGAELASEDGFICCSCGAGRYTVVWPDNRADIETVLDSRPVANRNWHLGETVDDLLAEVP